MAARCLDASPPQPGNTPGATHALQRDCRCNGEAAYPPARPGGRSARPEGCPLAAVSLAGERRAEADRLHHPALQRPPLPRRRHRRDEALHPRRLLDELPLDEPSVVARKRRLLLHPAPRPLQARAERERPLLLARRRLHRPTDRLQPGAHVPHPNTQAATTRRQAAATHNDQHSRFTVHVAAGHAARLPRLALAAGSSLCRSAARRKRRPAPRPKTATDKKKAASRLTRSRPAADTAAAAVRVS